MNRLLDRGSSRALSPVLMTLVTLFPRGLTAADAWLGMDALGIKRPN
jgi:hypothetical protein